MSTIEVRIASGADDVEERTSGSVAMASSDLELVVDGTKVQTVGLRFTGIDIPQGAIITNAYIHRRGENRRGIARSEARTRAMQPPSPAPRSTSPRA